MGHSIAKTKLCSTLMGEGGHWVFVPPANNCWIILESNKSSRKNITIGKIHWRPRCLKSDWTTQSVYDGSPIRHVGLRWVYFSKKLFVKSSKKEMFKLVHNLACCRFREPPVAKYVEISKQHGVPTQFESLQSRKNLRLNTK